MARTIDFVLFYHLGKEVASKAGQRLAADEDTGQEEDEDADVSQD
jgi:hypothetical protein